MTTIYWWKFSDENSALCGEEFFTELEDAGNPFRDHLIWAEYMFPKEELTCLGEVTEEEAEMMGLDTY